ncbi:NAD(P)H-hydrate dehydratase [candidate division WOR-3 bacterium]|nr:NAD(P)H-hydrate dehydratase [candidate division WOR-3 bacterium]
MKLVTPEEMKKIDEKAIKGLGISGAVLMENAGLGLFEIIQEEAEQIKGLKVGIICGKGNNGGDGFVLARHLLNNGADIGVFLLGKIQEIKGDACLNLDILLKSGFEIKELKTKKDILMFEQECLKSDLLVDAIFGTGFKGKVKGIAENVINIMNKIDIPVLAIDVPSGLNAQDGSIEGVCIKADFTGTMCLPKSGLFLYPGKDYAGDVYVIDIGVPPKLWENINLELLEAPELINLLPERPGNSHKGTFGKVFIVAGSRGMTGAAALTSLSALKIGAGLVRLGIPESLNPILEQKVTEVITVPLAETKDGTLSVNALNKIIKEIKEATVVAIGPGLSTHVETKMLVQKLVPEISVPLVIDADGINNLTLETFKKIKAPLIITPHPGELSKLIGLTVSDIQHKRIDIAFQFAKKLGVTFILKGAPTIIASKDIKYLNPVYNSGLASAGSGDVLTGIIAGLLAQGLSLIDSARLGVYIHGLSGEIAAEKLTEYSTIAGDIMNAIPEAIKKLKKSGFTIIE